MEISVLAKRFFDTAVADTLRALDGRALVGATTLSLLVLDYLSELRGGSGRAGYRSVANDFLASRINFKYVPDRLYALRCALVHTYAESNYMQTANLSGYELKHLDPAFHLSGIDGVLRLNVESFVTDIAWATRLFFASLPTTPADLQRVKANGDKLLIVRLSDSEADKSYKDMHCALKELDKKLPDYNDLSADIAAILSSEPKTPVWVDVSTPTSITGK